MRRITNQFPWEALVWITGLVAMAIYDPQKEAHVLICPLQHLGLEFCPGCGLGRSISFLFHGELMHSLSAHPLGILAVIVLSYRIVELTKHYHLNQWQK